jgi:hypothetical protein
MVVLHAPILPPLSASYIEPAVDSRPENKADREIGLEDSETPSLVLRPKKELFTIFALLVWQFHAASRS